MKSALPIRPSAGPAVAERVAPAPPAGSGSARFLGAVPGEERTRRAEPAALAFVRTGCTRRLLGSCPADKSPSRWARVSKHTGMRKTATKTQISTQCLRRAVKPAPPLLVS